MGKAKKNNITDDKKIQRYLRRLDMENIKALGLEEYFKQLIQIKPHEAIAQITQDLLNLIMLRERDFFLNSPEQIEKLKEELYSYAKEIMTKELPSDCFSLIIDAYHTEIFIKRIINSALFIYRGRCLVICQNLMQKSLM